MKIHQYLDSIIPVPNICIQGTRVALRIMIKVAENKSMKGLEAEIGFSKMSLTTFII